MGMTGPLRNLLDEQFNLLGLCSHLLDSYTVADPWRKAGIAATMIILIIQGICMRALIDRRTIH